MKICVVCGKGFERGPKERPAGFAKRVRCGFYCRLLPVGSRLK